MESTVTSLASEPLLWVGVAAVGLFFLCLWFAESRRYKAAVRLIDEQFNIVDKVELKVIREHLQQGQREQFDKLIAKVKRQGDNCVRKGHLVWALGILEGKYEPGNVPSMAPPASEPYRLERDIGAPALRRFLVAKVDGELIKAYEALREAAEKGSPVAMTHYGAALVRGEVPGLPPNPKAVHWLERAADKSGGATGAAELGFFLVEGEFMPRDTRRGLQLLERTYAGCGDTLGVWDLAEIYRSGLHGVVTDEAAALRWAMTAAPSWRQQLARLGISQVSWMDQRLTWLRERKANLTNRSPWERQRSLDRFVSDLRRGINKT